MLWTNLLSLALVTASLQTPRVMPQRFYQDLDSGDGVWALSELKRDPSLMRTRGPEEDETPLLLAACRGHTKLVKWLVAHGAEVNAKCYNDFTPLHLAANGEIATILLRAGARTDVRSAFGATPMQYAADNGGHGEANRVEVVQAMRRFGVPLDLESALLLDWRQDARKVLRLHPEQAKAETNEETPLDVAAKNGDIETAKALLKAGAILDDGPEPGNNFGYGKYTPLCAAVWGKHADMVEFLCHKGANPHTMGHQLERALMTSTPEIRATLKKYSALKSE